MFGFGSKFGFKVVLLDEDEYESVYDGIVAPLSFTGTLTKTVLSEEFELFDSRLREAVSQKWEIDEFGGCEKDCAISDEWQEGFFHCGGIYTNRICCGSYVQTILDVMATLPHADRWAYHTAVEILNDDDPIMGFGEFLIRAGEVLAPRDGNKYRRILNRK